MCNLVIHVLTLNLDNIFPILVKFGFSIFVGRRRNETTDFEMTDLLTVLKVCRQSKVTNIFEINDC